MAVIMTMPFFEIIIFKFYRRGLKTLPLLFYATYIINFYFVCFTTLKMLVVNEKLLQIILKSIYKWRICPNHYFIYFSDIYYKVYESYF